MIRRHTEFDFVFCKTGSPCDLYHDKYEFFAAGINVMENHISDKSSPVIPCLLLSLPLFIVYERFQRLYDRLMRYKKLFSRRTERIYNDLHSA